MNLYIIRDTVSRMNSGMTTAPSDDCAIRDLGIAMKDCPPRLAKDIMLVRIGEIQETDTYPLVVGYPVPVPVCTVEEALHEDILG